MAFLEAVGYLGRHRSWVNMGLQESFWEEEIFLAEFGLGGEASSPGVSKVKASPDALVPFSVFSLRPLLFVICPKKYTLVWGQIYSV